MIGNDNCAERHLPDSRHETQENTEKRGLNKMAADRYTKHEDTSGDVYTTTQKGAKIGADDIYHEGFGRRTPQRR